MNDLSNLTKDIQKLVIAKDVLTSYFSRGDKKLHEKEWEAVKAACNYISESLKSEQSDAKTRR